MPVAQDDFQEKLARLRQCMAAHGLTPLLLASQTSFAWLTGGRGHILQTGEESCGSLLVTAAEICLLTNNIEAERLLAEEMPGIPLPVQQVRWDRQPSLRDLAAAHCGGRAPACDLDPAVERVIGPLRWTLSPGDQTRYRAVCRESAQALEAACRRVRAGQTEFQVAALVAAESIRLGLDPALILVASDGRVYSRRHPLPTARPVERYAMLVLCARRHGLIAACTRLVHIGQPDAELRRRHRAVAVIDAGLIAATRPGVPVREIFARAVEAYAATGFADEWMHHHQGGLIGYRGREYFATATSAEVVAAGQAFAWNPSVAGAKSEDTILVTRDGLEILTQTGAFPTLAVDAAGAVILRPDILVI
jgi:Xaa-Pro aminopeptidase